MNSLIQSPLGRYRLLGFLEGGSLLLLMGVAMPLKYVFDNPLWVKIIGPVHGILFILYVIETLRFSAQLKWKLLPVTLPLLIGSLLPFGTFVADYRILRPLVEKKAT